MSTLVSPIDGPDEAERELAELQGHENAATHRQLELVRYIEADGLWRRQGGKSCAHWLAWRLDIDPGAAREKVRVACALGALPAIDEALRGAELSYSKVRAMTRVATPANEASLLEMARHSTAAQLEKICRALRRVDQDEQPAEQERYVHVRDRADGTVRLEAVLLPDEAVRVMEALRALCASMPDADLCDALVHMANGARADSSEKTRTSGADRADVVVHLMPGTIEGERTTTLDDGTHVSAETFRRLACNAGIIVVKEDGRGNVLDVGRKTRTPPPALQRALHIQFGGTCCFPGCTNTRFIEGHHIESWLHGGETKIGNLCPLCSFHHRFVHEGGWRIEMEDGVPRFIAPTGVVSSVPLLSAPRTDVLESYRALHSELAIDDETCLTLWNGETPDYAECVEQLLPADSLSIGEWLALHADGAEGAIDTVPR